MRILLTGGTGFIGKALACNLIQSSKHTVYVYTHQKSLSDDVFDSKIQVVYKDSDFPEVDCIVNLAGASIAAKALSSKRCTEIVQSRIDTIELLQRKYATNFPKQFIQASATGIYVQGDNLDETSLIANTTYAQMCKQIEAKASSVKSEKQANIRLGVVVGQNGGIVQNLKYLPRPYIIKATNFVPYISLNDCVRAIRFIIENSLDGNINLCSDKFMQVNYLLEKCKDSSIFVLPTFKSILKIDKRCDLLLTNQKIKPQKLLENGFIFNDFQ